MAGLAVTGLVVAPCDEIVMIEPGKKLMLTACAINHKQHNITDSSCFSTFTTTSCNHVVSCGLCRHQPAQTTPLLNICLPVKHVLYSEVPLLAKSNKIHVRSLKCSHTAFM